MMESIPEFKSQKVCRICLKTDLLVSVFSPSFIVRPIEMIEKLNIFTKLRLDDDTLPKLLCQSCLYRLLDAYNLQQIAQASERELREYFGNQTKASNVTLSGHPHYPFTTSPIVARGEYYSENTRTEPFASPSISMCDRDAETSSGIYANICDIFDCPSVVEENITQITTAPDEVLNDVEIDVSSLTRSESEDTLGEAFVVGGSQSYGLTPPTNFMISAKEEKKPTRPTNERKIPSLLEEGYDDENAFKTPRCKETSRPKTSGFKIQDWKNDVALDTTNACDHLQHREDAKQLPLDVPRRFQCEICAAFFTTSSNLNAHRAIHTDRRDFQCPRCSLRFKTPRELRRHEPVHKLAKEFVCEICSKAFHKRGYLNSHHATVHEGIRRYRCTDCDKVFGSKSNLVCHQRTHSGEKPFECKHCAWRFSQSSALARHMKQHVRQRAGSVSAMSQNSSVHHSDGNMNIQNKTELDESETALDCSVLRMLIS